MIFRTNQNGVSQNGVSQNGTNGNGTNGNGHAPTADLQEGQFKAYKKPFGQPVILRQSPVWSRAIVWTILGVTTASVTWACLAKVEETIPAQGKLEPEGVVQPVQAPSGGVIDEIHVKEGEYVDQGELLVTFDQEAAQAELNSLREIRQQLTAENEYYRAQRTGGDITGIPDGVAGDLDQRLRERNTLATSNRVYQAQLDGDISGLSLAQQAAVQTARGNMISQKAEAQDRIASLIGQRNQAEIDLASAQSELATNQEILTSLQNLEAEGAVARLSRLQQDQEVSSSQARVGSLREEIARMNSQISEQQNIRNRAEGEFRQNLDNLIRSNGERISSIDSTLGQALIQNEGQLQEIKSRISQLEQTLKYQVLTAPVGGTVFNLKANQPGYAANSTEPILEIVPEDKLVARVFVPNKDIGFVKLGQTVDVRIDAFPYSEFGDVDGKILSIGSDALPPDEVFPFYRFPVEIELDSQTLNSNGTDLVLRSGMSLNANIKLRKRRVITFFSDLFVNKLDSVRSGG
ncbi:MAG: HlyD family efflux transporter periplasmic adaptor subunit [Cyanobacteria bacterium P01_D01_bin.44]